MAFTTGLLINMVLQELADLVNTIFEESSLETPAEWVFLIFLVIWSFYGLTISFVDQYPLDAWLLPVISFVGLLFSIMFAIWGPEFDDSFENTQDKFKFSTADLNYKERNVFLLNIILLAPIIWFLGLYLSMLFNFIFYFRYFFKLSVIKSSILSLAVISMFYFLLETYLNMGLTRMGGELWLLI